MRKNLQFMFYFMLTLAPGYFSMAQTPVTNGGFEQWTTLSLFEHPVVTPSAFESSNYETFFRYNGALNVTKVTGASGFAIRLETKVFQGDTVFGYGIFGGNPGDSDVPVFPGGFPFTDKNVTGIKGKFRYNISLTSPGMLIVQFKNNGVPIGGTLQTPGMYMFTFSGSQPNFTEQILNFTPALPSVPDEVAIAFVSNDPFNESSVSVPGNFLEIDDLSFTGTTATVPGGNFNNWSMLPGFEYPTAWDVEYNPALTLFEKSSDKNSGSFSLRLNTIVEGNATWVGQASLGKEENSGTKPVMALTGVPLSLSFHYKYITLATDTATVWISLTKWNGTSRSYVGGSYEYLTAQTAFTSKSIPIFINPLQTADSIAIRFESSYRRFDDPVPGYNVPQNGSALYIDDIVINYAVTGVSSATAQTVSVFPNPSSDGIFHLNTGNQEPGEIKILNALMQEVEYRKSVSSGITTLDLSAAPSGVYYILLSENGEVVSGKLVKN
jgi:hypothetical protein